MNLGLKTICSVVRDGFLRAFILLSVFMFVSESLALAIQAPESRCVATPCVNADEVFQNTDELPSQAGDNSCSESGHCHQHHCQVLAVATISIAAQGSRSVSLTQHERVPSSPFIDRVPRPPAI